MLLKNKYFFHGSVCSYQFNCVDMRILFFFHVFILCVVLFVTFSSRFCLPGYEIRIIWRLIQSAYASQSSKNPAFHPPLIKNKIIRTTTTYPYHCLTHLIWQAMIQTTLDCEKYFYHALI